MLDAIQVEEIRMDQLPTQCQWRLIPLYKPSANGGLLFWQVGFDGIKDLEIAHGYDNGVIRKDKTEIKVNMSGRNLQEQALLDARHRYTLKYKEGYQPAGSTTVPSLKIMKGYEYKQGSVKNWPVYTQPKLDGIRMACQDIGQGKISMKSWLNNPFTHLTHIENELRDFFPYLPRHCTLDGELYNHDMGFTLLTSAIKTVKSVHPSLKHVQYWMFDIDYEDHQGTPYEDRCALLVNAFNRYVEDHNITHVKNLVVVPTKVARSHEDVLEQHKLHIASGYEGIMIKKISNGYPINSKHYAESLYRCGKCNHILKYKEFIDEEVIIVGVTEAEGTEKGAAIFNVKDRRGNTFPVRMRGTVERRKYWFQNPSTVIGKEATIRYQELSLYGVPRFPIGVSIRDYE